MDFITEPERKVPLRDAGDVLVLGGGPAGMIAAMAAASRGASTTLVERYGFLGGMATAALVGPFAGTRHRYGGGRIIGGIPWELILRLVRHGGATLDTFCYPSDGGSSSDPDDSSPPGLPAGLPAGSSAGSRGTGRGDIPFDPEVLKWVSEQMALEAGVRLQYHSAATGVVKTEKQISAVLVESKSGRQALCARVIVDATGDADIAAFAGVPFETGRPGDGALQPMTLMFRLGGVDTDGLGDISRPFVPPFIRRKAEEAVAREKLPVFGGPWTFWGSTFRPGEVMVNMVRLWGDATDVEVLTRNEITGRAHMQQFVAFLKENFTEFKNSFLIDSGPQIGIRETRRIRGAYVLTGEDIRGERKFSDAVALGGHVIDIHSPDGTSQQVRKKVSPYQIPYRCLLPQGIGNLLVAGRPISASHEAHASLRVMGTCMATGQAAGVAAAMAARKNGDPAGVDIADLQGALLETGALIHGGVSDPHE